jgi:hypothetical protein
MPKSEWKNHTFKNETTNVNKKGWTSLVYV